MGEDKPDEMALLAKQGGDMENNPKHKLDDK